MLLPNSSESFSNILSKLSVKKWKSNTFLSGGIGIVNKWWHCKSTAEAELEKSHSFICFGYKQNKDNEK